MIDQHSPDLSTGQLAEAACLLEARAPKPGNVHPQASFQDTTFDDFLRSAAAIRQTFDHAAEKSVGELVIEAVEATLATVGRNTNLGIVLLLAPLSKTPASPDVASAAGRQAIRAAVDQVVRDASARDVALIYEAIRKAAPGGLGTVDQQDVARPPERSLIDVMELASARDLIARQYTGSFEDVVDVCLVDVVDAIARRESLENAIVGCALRTLARMEDSLIARKCGIEVARDAMRRARSVLDLDWPHTSASRERFAAFDSWLRSDGNRRNPGATADLIAAALFLALRGGIIAFSDEFNDGC